MKTFFFIVCLSFVMVFSGCGDGRPLDMPSLRPAELTFTQDGSPLSNAYITLYSSEPNYKWAVSGETDAAGKVVLMTHGRYAGAPEGKYKITVDKVKREGPPVPKESELPADEEERARVFNDIDKKTKHVRVVDDKYLDINTTPLEVEIAGGNNSKTFDLGKPTDTVLPDN